MTLIGLVCRFKPVHLGHAAMLEALCDRADLVRIGLGSPNRYDLRNPFTAGESAQMIRRALGRRENYELIEVPDLGHGPRWRAMVQRLFGPLDVFVSANDYVRSLLGEVYELAHPREMVPSARHVRVDGTMVRRAMARGDGWRELVPPAVAEFLAAGRLPERFRQEFGLATLVQELGAALPGADPREVTDVLLG